MEKTSIFLPKQVMVEYGDTHQQGYVVVTNWWDNKGFDIEVCVHTGPGGNNLFQMSLEQWNILNKIIKEHFNV